jgi:hypothetical protein
VNTFPTHRAVFEWLLLVVVSLIATLAIPEHIPPAKPAPEPKKIVCTGMKMFDPLKCSTGQKPPVKKTK